MLLGTKRERLASAKRQIRTLELKKMYLMK